MPAWRSAAAREGITYTSATPGAHAAIAQRQGGGSANGSTRGAAAALGRSGTMRAFSWTTKAERATAVPGGATRRATWTHKWFHKRVLSEPLDARHPIVAAADMLVVVGLLFTATFTMFQVGYLVGNSAE